jgi:predicted TPR repeat methyltransferase
MPTSSVLGKDFTIDWIRQTPNLNNILDIGAGEGTYPNLCKNENNLLTNSKWYGVEAWEPYITEYNLTSLYDVLINEDVRKLDWQCMPNFDLVICGDVLEHMTKEESQSVVESALSKTRYLLISIPIVKAKQGAVGGNPFEIHVKDNWSHEEVIDSFSNIVESHTTKRIGVYIS